MSLQPPYGVIAQALRNGRVVPFLGAGVNQPYLDVSPDFAKLPTGPELSRALAALSTFPADSDQDLIDLTKVASYFVESSGRTNLRDTLHQTFNKEYTPCKIHEYLAEVTRPLLIVTTNYDDLTEKAFEEKRRPFDVVVHQTDKGDMAGSVLWWKHGSTSPETHPPNTLPINERLKTTTVIYKMHGTVVRPWLRRLAALPPVDDDNPPYCDDSYVITEEDYIEFLHRMTTQQAVPMQVMTYFTSRQFLFLGYGLRDWNLRVVLKNLNSILRLQKGFASEDPSWAIQLKPSLLEQELWERRRVKIYDLDVNEFVEELRKF